MKKGARNRVESGIGLLFISISFFCFGAAFLVTQLYDKPAFFRQESLQKIGSFAKNVIKSDGEKSGMLEIQNTIPLYLITLGEKDGLSVNDTLDVYTADGNNIGRVRITCLYDLGADVVPVPETKKYPDGSYKVIWRKNGK